MGAGESASEPRHHYREVAPEDPVAARLKHVTPVLRVDAVSVSVQHYVEQLGFQLAWDWGDPATFACVKRGDVAIFLSEKSQGVAGVWVFVDVDDVDRLYEEYLRRGAKVAKPPADYPWGRREMLVEDPDGHCMRFASAPTGQPPASAPRT